MEDSFRGPLLEESFRGFSQRILSRIPAEDAFRGFLWGALLEDFLRRLLERIPSEDSFKGLLWGISLVTSLNFNEVKLSEIKYCWSSTLSFTFRGLLSSVM